MLLKSLATTAALIGLSAASASAEMTESRVKELIEEYLRDNPRTIIESLQTFQVKEEAARVEKQQKAIKETVGVFTAKGNHYGQAGNPDGDVVVVEFFDYNCPACKMMFESLDQLLKEDTNVRVVLVEYPIFGPQSDRIALLAHAFNELEPEKYFTFHSTLMRHKGKIDETMVLNTAAGLGVSKDKLNKEADDPKYQAMIEKDREIAAKLQIRGTPAVIVGTKMADGALPIERLREHVQWAREDKDGAAR